MSREFGGLALALAIIGTLGVSRADAPAPPAAATLKPARPVRVTVGNERQARPTVVFSVAPEWGYRFFVDAEPSSVDKHYRALGIFGLRLHAEIYPLAALGSGVADAWRDIGVIGTYTRAFGLESQDIDKVPPPPEIVETEWYHYLIGLRYRALGGTSPLSLGFSVAFERWVFDFDTTPNQRRFLPIARYSLLPIGADGRFSVGPFAFLGAARLLLPLSKAPFGDRVASGSGFGFHLETGVAFTPVPAIEFDLRAAYTTMRFSLPSLPRRADESGTVLDHYLVFSAGATLQF